MLKPDFRKVCIAFFCGFVDRFYPRYFAAFDTAFPLFIFFLVQISDRFFRRLRRIPAIRFLDGYFDFIPVDFRRSHFRAGVQCFLDFCRVIFTKLIVRIPPRKEGRSLSVLVSLYSVLCDVSGDCFYSVFVRAATLGQKRYVFFAFFVVEIFIFVDKVCNTVSNLFPLQNHSDFVFGVLSVTMAKFHSLAVSPYLVIVAATARAVFSP